MLFVTDAVFEARQHIMLALANHQIDEAQAFRRCLELDPEDHLSMAFLGSIRATNGDSAGAEELLWRAIQIAPCSYVPYMKLAEVLALSNR